MNLSRAWIVGLVGLLLSQVVVAESSEEPAEHAAGLKVLRTAALLPFSNRAGEAYEHLSSSISLAAGHAVLERTSLVLLDRDRLVHLVDEQQLVDAGLVAPGEAERERMIPAEVLVYGHYDVVDGQLSIEAELLPAQFTVANGIVRTPENGVSRIRSHGPVEDTVKLVEQFSADLAAAFTRLADELDVTGEADPSAGAADAAEPADGPRIVAVFDLVEAAVPAPEAGRAALLTQQIRAAFAEATDVQLVERQRLNVVLQEMELGLAGMSPQGKAMLVGRLVSAHHLIVGAVVGSGQQARVDVHVLDAARGAVIATATAPLNAEPASDLSQTAERLVEQLLAGHDAGVHRLGQLNGWEETAHPEGVVLANRATTIHSEGDGPESARKATAEYLIAAALKLSPEAGWVHHHAGLIAYSSGQNDEAYDHARRAAELLPDQPHPAHRVAMIYLVRRDDAAAAIPWFERALALFEAMEDHDQGATNITNAFYGQALHDVGRTDEAIEVLQNATKHWYSGGAKWRLYNKLGLIFWEQERWQEAAEAYETAGRLHDSHSSTFNLQQAIRAYDHAGQPDEAVRVIRMRAGLRQLNTIQWRRLAEGSSDLEPALAAEIAYVRPSRINPDHRDDPHHDLQWTHALLERLGRPTTRPIRTGPVFDIEALRRRGVFAHAQVYGSFRHPQVLPYLKQHYEDVLGIPLNINATPRPFPVRSYMRDADGFLAHDPFKADVNELADQTDAASVIALTSVNNLRMISARFRHARGFISTYQIDQTMRLQEHRTDPFDAASYSVYAPQFIKVTGAGLIVADKPLRPDENHCVAHSCILRMFRTTLRSVVPVPCDHCRQRLHDIRPDWEPGPEHRDPIVAGPTSPAVTEPAGHVLLIVGGLDSNDAHFDAAAHAITLSTGLPVRTLAYPEPPSIWRAGLGNEKSFLPRERLIAWAREHDDVSELTLAICLLVNDNVLEVDRRWLPWTLAPMRTGGADADDPAAAPVLLVQFGAGRFAHMPNLRRLRLLETIELPGVDETFQSPAYAKHLIAGLATLANEQQSCWTYGCPTTIWPFIVDPARCSIWLCEACRHRMADAFSRP
ncbi:MAG: tetratricopeptide repeat protein [Phycisphaeraceae bacterium]